MPISLVYFYKGVVCDMDTLVLMVACPGHILEGTKGIEMKPGL